MSLINLTELFKRGRAALMSLSSAGTPPSGGEIRGRAFSVWDAKSALPHQGPAYPARAFCPTGYFCRRGPAVLRGRGGGGVAPAARPTSADAPPILPEGLPPTLPPPAGGPLCCGTGVCSHPASPSPSLRPHSPSALQSALALAKPRAGLAWPWLRKPPPAPKTRTRETTGCGNGLAAARPRTYLADATA